MQKAICIFRDVAGESYSDFKTRMFSLCRKLENELDPMTVTLTLTTRRAPLVSVIPFKKRKVAAISASYTDAPRVGSLAGEPGFEGLYPVVEEVPVRHEKSWPDGSATPGVCLLTLFHRKPGISYEKFIDRWHNSHTPLSLRIHPLWNYNRNVVEDPGQGTARYEGIVEEHFRTARELLNPFIFFGPPLKVPRHMMQVLTDTRTFIDMRRIETYLAQTYIMKS